MPQSKWIDNAQMIPEGKTYKVDSASRIAIPAHLRAKFGVQNGDEMEYYTTFVDGKWFMCVTRHVPEEEETIDE